jgi:CRP/FNR family transcriptional regulator, cyclic AMP receptor protein
MGLVDRLPEPIRSSLMEAGSPRSYDRGQIVFHQGDPASSLHIIRSGRVAVQMGSTNGAMATVNVLGPDDVFGEMGVLLLSGTRSATIRALQPTATTMITAATFTTLRMRHPAVDRALLESLAERLEYMSRRVSEAHSQDVLHRCLNRLAELVPRDSAGPIALDITQENLADIVGTTRPSINQSLQRLQQRGLLTRLRGRIVVQDPCRLRAAAGTSAA